MHNLPFHKHNQSGKILVVLGTRPEAIKLAPVITALRRSASAPEVFVAATGQHRELVRPVLDFFGIVPDVNLDIMRPDQSPAGVVQRTLEQLEPVLDSQAFDLMLVQGDTSSAAAGALAGFYRKIPVGHVEAGLRTGDLHDPFPEEMNRRLISTLSTFHFAPTDLNRQNLLREGIPDSQIFVTGNTVIDALQSIVEHTEETPLQQQWQVPRGTKRILLTTHRRENFGEPQHRIFRAINHLLEKHEELSVLFPVHPNPNVQKAVQEYLHASTRLQLIEPLDYITFVRLMKTSWLILTDSGGIQEEAPALGTPAFVLRETTERSEALATTNTRLTGTDTNALVAAVEHLLANPGEYAEMTRPSYPFGEPGAAERICRILMS